METIKTALVIGATGGVGGAVAEALLARGWRVRALTRNLGATRTRSADLAAVEWVAGDAMNREDVVAAARGAAVIFHGAHPPKYQKWRELCLPMLAHSIAAAKATGARLVFPGTIYNYGPDAGSVLREASPQHPKTRKGAIRVELEEMLKAAAVDGVRSLVVRAGDFFGGHSPSSWFQAAMVKPGRPVRSVTYPGRRDVGHAWAYLPDLAESIARLADIEATLPDFEAFHFGGHWMPRGVAMAEAIGRAVGNPSLPIRSMPWPLLYLASPFVPFLRELIEMRYLWRQPLRLDNARLVAVLGREPHTPLDQAVRETLEALGCLPAPAEGLVPA